MSYKYVAYDKNRQLVKGSVDVDSEQMAKDVLRDSGYSLLSLAQGRKPFNMREQLPALFGVKSSDVVTFSRMFATLVSRGTNTLTALELLRDQISNKTFQKVIQAVSDDVRRGMPLADAMAKHPDSFPPIYSRTIRVSEQTGNLESSLNHIADYIEKQNVLVSKVGRSLAYPAFVFVVGLGVVTLLILVTLPALSDLFMDLGGELPLPSRIMVGLTDFLTKYILLFLAVGATGVATLIAFMKHPRLRPKLDAAMLRIPLIGPVITLREMINFSRTVSTCLSSSIPMPDTLGLAVQTTRNLVMTRVLENVREEVLKGRGLSQILSESSVFPRPLIQMVRVGEQASTLGDDLGTISALYEAEIDKRIDTIVAVLGPGIMLFLGVFVAFIAVSMVMPIYTFLGQID